MRRKCQTNKAANIPRKRHKMEHYAESWQLCCINFHKATWKVIYYAATVRITYKHLSGCGSVWLERCVRDAEAGGSNPLTPTIFFVLYNPVLYDWIFLYRTFTRRTTGIYSKSSPRQRIQEKICRNFKIFVRYYRKSPLLQIDSKLCQNTFAGIFRINYNIALQFIKNNDMV